LLTRDEAIELVKKYDVREPQVLDYFLKCTNLTADEFYSIISKEKHEELEGLDLTVSAEKHYHEENLIPFTQQIISKYRPKHLQ